jgi:hypothetical protein
MLSWTPRQWSISTVIIIGVLTTAVVILNIIGIGLGIASCENIATFLLGVYGFLFAVIGTYVGIGTVKSLSRKGLPDAMAGPSLKQQKATQITVCMMVTVPLVFLLIAISLWRGRYKLSARQFLAYLIIRHTTEVIFCIVVHYAAKNDSVVLDRFRCALNRMQGPRFSNVERFFRKIRVFNERIKTASAVTAAGVDPERKASVRSIVGASILVDDDSFQGADEDDGIDL